MKRIIACFVGLVLSVPLCAAAGEDGPAPADPGTVMDRLGSSTWEERQEAQNSLLDPDMFPSEDVVRAGLEKLVRNDDPEIAYRVREILYILATRNEFREDKGFLGVTLSQSFRVLSFEGRKVQPIDIVSVMPNTPASTNGLRQGIQVVGIDDRLCTAKFGVPEMVRHIQSKDPGDNISLAYFENGKAVTNSIPLTVRPALPGDLPIETQKRNYFDNWLEKNLAETRKRLARVLQ